MLTIQNITKVWKRDVAGWRIGKIETMPGAYLFQLFKSNGERLQVNLERNSIAGEYEMWHWKPVKGNQYPERLMFPKYVLDTPDKFINAMNLLLM
jgi:hypothetical protein